MARAWRPISRGVFRLPDRSVCLLCGARPVAVRVPVRTLWGGAGIYQRLRSSFRRSRPSTRLLTGRPCCLARTCARWVARSFFWTECFGWQWGHCTSLRLPFVAIAVLPPGVSPMVVGLTASCPCSGAEQCASACLSTCSEGT